MVGLEVVVNLVPLFAQPINMKEHNDPLDDMPRKSIKTRKAQELLQGVQRMVVVNIEYRVNILSKLWELAY